jgi:YebC/PmpR family DNA-binding regulatory protein
MSGHSKWNNIKRKKEKTDGAKAKIFTKVGRELAVAVKEGGGPDPSSNSKLKDCIAKAKACNVPNDNIERIIKKAAGDGDANKYESIVYEGYGPNGVAVIVETLTDNRNRTAGEVRHYFDKFGGNLGTTGCVSFMFAEKGVIIIEREGNEEDKVMEDCLEAGAADFQADEDVFEIYTEPDDFSGVLEDLEKKKYEFVSAEVEMVPNTYTTLTEEDSITKMQRLLDALDDNEDVQNVWHNWDAPETDDEEE